MGATGNAAGGGRVANAPEPGTACLLNRPGSHGARAGVPCVVVRVSSSLAQVETVGPRGLRRRWVDPRHLTPDPERTHRLWPVYDHRVRADRALEEAGR